MNGTSGVSAESDYRISPTCLCASFAYVSQAKVSAADAHVLLSSLSDQPLLFVDHPVMLTHSATDSEADLAALQEKLRYHFNLKGRKQAWSVPAHAMPLSVTPDQELALINRHIAQGRCKANWVSDGTLTTCG